MGNTSSKATSGKTIEQLEKEKINAECNLYQAVCQEVETDKEILSSNPFDETMKNGDAILLKAKELDSNLPAVSKDEDLNPLLSTATQTLLNAANESEQVINHTKATLYYIASLLEYKAADCARTSTNFAQQLLDIDIQRMQSLEIAFIDESASKETKAKALSHYHQLNATKKSSKVDENGHKFFNLGMQFHKASKSVFVFVENPSVSTLPSSICM